jgi:hypothetical protein
MQTRRNRLKRNSQKGGLGVFHADVRGNNSNGKTYRNTNFMKKNNNRGFDYQWQEINKKLESHLKEHVSDDNLVQSGFGGDDGEGYVVLGKRVNIPPMKFSLNDKKYVMKFERYVEHN